MATLYVSRVDHRLYKWPYFDIPDEDKEFIYYRVEGQVEPELNWKHFVIEMPKLRKMMGGAVFDSIAQEMRHENFHDISYMRVSNREFRQRIDGMRRYRLYYNGAWYTLYFNERSRSMVTFSDFGCAMLLYMSFPAKGLTNFLFKPCTKEGASMAIPKCYEVQWAILANTDTEEDYDVLTGYRCYSPPYPYLFENYFYVKPGEPDLMLEGFCIDYERGVDSELKSSEYYILDREGSYFKEGTTNFELFKQDVLRKFNAQGERYEMWAKRDNGEYKRQVIAYKSTGTYDSFAQLFAYLGRSLVGRHNAFHLQWNRYMSHFNQSDDGYYCPPRPEDMVGAPPSMPQPPAVPIIDPQMLMRASGSLMSDEFDWYTPSDLSITTYRYARFYDSMEGLFAIFALDKESPLFGIGVDTQESLTDFAIDQIHTYRLDSQ